VQSPDGYFVRLNTAPAPLVDHDRHGRELSKPVARSRRRKRFHMRYSILLLVGLAVWLGWASQRPGGISGTVNGWIENVRGDVVKVSADPDLHKAAKYYNDQFKATDAYPQLTEDELATHGVGMGVTVVWCNTQAVVIQGAVGGGTASRLLINGHEIGTVTGKQDCPVSLADPSPWHT
jgi:hypothetical protein